MGYPMLKYVVVRSLKPNIRPSSKGLKKKGQ
jgi:hypothetical protein